LSPAVLYALAAPSTPDELVKDVTERSANGEQFAVSDIKAMKDEWDGERKELKRQATDAKEKAKDARAIETGVVQQLDELRAELATLRDARDTLQTELAMAKNVRSAVKHADKPLNDLETREQQVSALMSAWNKAGQQAREEFMKRVDSPLMDQRFR